MADARPHQQCHRDKEEARSHPFQLVVEHLFQKQHCHRHADGKAGQHQQPNCIGVQRNPPVDCAHFRHDGIVLAPAGFAVECLQRAGAINNAPQPGGEDVENIGNRHQHKYRRERELDGMRDHVGRSSQHTGRRKGLTPPNPPARRERALQPGRGRHCLRALRSAHAFTTTLVAISTSTTLGSASVEVSPRLLTSPSAILRRMRRMILPLRVFGRPGAK